MSEYDKSLQPNLTNREIEARTALWVKLAKLVDVVTLLLQQAVNEAHKVQQDRKRG